MNHLSRGLVLGFCGASILACILRAHRIYLLQKQGPGAGHSIEILSTRRHYHFLFVVIAHTFISLSTVISFGVLVLVDGDGSLMVASGSVVLLSMIGQVSASQTTSISITDSTSAAGVGDPGIPDNDPSIQGP
jgi:hypothetical protein